MQTAYQKQRAREANTTHGYSARGKKARLYRIWTNIKSRCTNPNVTAFKDYGGRGITVCDAWLDDFAAFRDWAEANGYSDELTLERIDNDEGYAPGNCRWATQSEQNNNSRRNRILEHDGTRHTIAEWSRITGLSRDTIRLRIDRRGWSVSDALTREARITKR